MGMNISGHDIVIVGVYAPNDDTVVQKKKFDIYAGDYWKQRRKKRERLVIGPYGKHQNETRLIETCEQFYLKYFQHKKEIHKSHQFNQLEIYSISLTTLLSRKEWM